VIIPIGSDDNLYSGDTTANLRGYTWAGELIVGSDLV
jgi:hypothetical protein